MRINSLRKGLARDAMASLAKSYLVADTHPCEWDHVDSHTTKWPSAVLCHCDVQKRSCLTGAMDDHRIFLAQSGDIVADDVEFLTAAAKFTPG
jgi:hypothetical protein